MPNPHRVVGLPSGGVDSDKHEIHFALAVSDGNKPFQFIAKYGVASQVIAGLGRMFLELRQILQAKNAIEPTAAEDVASTHIQKERWSDTVLLQITTPQGVPYTFAVPTKVASDIADQLKIESAKPTQTGSA